MKNKYVIVDVSCDEIYFVEMTSSQLEAMRWVTDKWDYDMRFYKIDSEQKFEEI